MTLLEQVLLEIVPDNGQHSGSRYWRKRLAEEFGPIVNAAEQTADAADDPDQLARALYRLRGVVARLRAGESTP